ncbi:MAG: hypothetical protein QW840_01960, partial [Candidatus Bathyarchaeia archaeon]
MSVELPRVYVSFGSVVPPEADIISLRVHLGCTREVSSFECLLQNWNRKYSQGGDYPISLGATGIVKIGRGSSLPMVMAHRCETLSYESVANENYVRVSGRCYGEKLFRRMVTKTYVNQKGEAIVKDVLDNFVGLSHTRGGNELVEDTDTTYALLDYQDAPAFDIIKYIAETADDNGVIGYDFRVAPDGCFEFFPRLSKASNISLTDKIESSEYVKNIHGVRNKITVLGYAGRFLPSDKDGWTESTLGWQTLVSGNTLELENTEVKVGSYSLEGHSGTSVSPRRCRFRKTFTAENMKQGVTLKGWYGSWLYQNPGDWDWQAVRLLAPDSSNYFQASLPYDSVVYWRMFQFLLGPNNEYNAVENPNGQWTKTGNPDWRQISGIEFDVQHHSTSEDLVVRVDGLFFEGLRFKATEEDSASQTAYGLRELVEVDEELYSNSECSLKAQALLDHLKSPVESLTIRSTVIDYGDTPILAGDKVSV